MAKRVFVEIAECPDVPFLIGQVGEVIRVDYVPQCPPTGLDGMLLDVRFAHTGVEHSFMGRDVRLARVDGA